MEYLEMAQASVGFIVMLYILSYIVIYIVDKRSKNNYEEDRINRSYYKLSSNSFNGNFRCVCVRIYCEMRGEFLRPINDLLVYNLWRSKKTHDYCKFECFREYKKLDGTEHFHNNKILFPKIYKDIGNLELKDFEIPKYVSENSWNGDYMCSCIKEYFSMYPKCKKTINDYLIYGLYIRYGNCEGHKNCKPIDDL